MPGIWRPACPRSWLRWRQGGKACAANYPHRLAAAARPAPQPQMDSSCTPAQLGDAVLADGSKQGNHAASDARPGVVNAYARGGLDRPGGEPAADIAVSRL